jgi:hypothetical protein
VLRNNTVREFWFSFSPVDAFIYDATQYNEFQSPLRDFALENAIQKAKFMIDLWSEVRTKNVRRRPLHSSLRSFEIAGVSIHILGPSEDTIRKEESRLGKALNSVSKCAPDPNVFSLILALEYRGKLIILAADALKSAWHNASKVSRELKLPKAVLLKVPHHGASNAFDLRPARTKPVNCWDLCSKSASAVLFAGDIKHPDKVVYDRLRQRFTVYSHFDVTGDQPVRDPLSLGYIGGEFLLQGDRDVVFSEFIVNVGAEGNHDVQPRRTGENA